MRYRGGPFLALLLAILALVMSAATVSAQTTLSTSLTGDEEAPGPEQRTARAG